MTINQLRYFLQICDCGSISNAAQILFISQQALSKSLNSLEAELGSSLFLRLKGRLILTDTGKYLLDHARPIVEQFDAFSLSLNQSIAYRNEQLKICMFEAGAYIFTQNDAEDFHAKYPQFTLKIQEHPYKVCNQLLLSGDADVIITLEPPPDKEIITIPLKSYERILILPKSSPLANCDAIDIEDLKSLRFILSMNERDLNVFYDLCHQNKFEPDVALKVPQISNMFELCEQYGYAALCSEFSTAKLIPRYSGLIQKNFKDNLFPFPTMLSYHVSKKNSKALKALIEYLRSKPV